MSLSVRGVEKALSGNPILRGVDLEARDAELVVLVGASGCGKSTLLRTIAGLERPDAGTIAIAGREVTAAPPRDRDVGMVFQSYALYPHLTVRDNMAFGLTLRKTPPAVVKERVDAAAAMLSLEPYLGRYPRELSGGQRQRVAMGRVLARRPTLYLFDEPLSNLDAALRNEVRIEIRKLHETLGATMIYVTHDQVEAMTLADQLVVMNRGRIEQAGPPLDLYARPRTEFVAGFLGSPAMNLFDGEVTAGELRAEGVVLAAPAGARPGAVRFGIRPEDVVQDEAGGIAFAVDVVERLGADAFAHGTVGRGRAVVRLGAEAARGVRAGDALRFRVVPGRVHLFDPATREALPS